MRKYKVQYWTIEDGREVIKSTEVTAHRLATREEINVKAGLSATQPTYIQTINEE